MLPSTPANWLYLESDCDGLSSDQAQTYSILTRLILTTDVKVARYRLCSVHRWFGEKSSATITEKMSQIVMVLVQTYGISRSRLNTDVNVTRFRSCSKSQEVLNQAWRDSIPGERSCQFLDLNNLNRWFGYDQAQQLQAPCASSR